MGKTFRKDNQHGNFTKYKKGKMKCRDKKQEEEKRDKNKVLVPRNNETREYFTDEDSDDNYMR